MPTGRPVIFLAFANDQQEGARYLRGLAKELRGIRKALHAARLAQAVDIVERSNCSLADIVDVFQDPEYRDRIRIFHYGGHAESYTLLLENEAQAQEIIHNEGLACFLANQPGLELVFLNGCSTQGHQQGLMEAGIRNVITTSTAINDEVATRFAIRFYKGLGSYASIQRAFVDATSEILALHGHENTRSLYWEENDQAPTHAYPWSIFPDPPTEWRLLSPEGSKIGEGPQLRVGRYAHVFCDRYPQNDEFASTHTGGKGHPPHIYLVHGIRDDRHESLITRFSYQYVGQRKDYLPPVEIPNWPFKGNLENLLKVRLAEQFPALNQSGKPIGQVSGEDLIRHVSMSGRQAVLIQHNIPAEYWNKDTQGLLQWYIDSFWNLKQVPLEAPQILIFINIFYPEQEKKSGGLLGVIFSRGSEQQRIAKDLEKIVKEAQGAVTLLSRLDTIHPSHVQDWLIETNLAELEEFHTFSKDVFKIEGKSYDALHMNEVEFQLKKAIKQIRDKYAIRDL